MAAKLEVTFASKYLPTLSRQRGNYEINRVELHKLMMKLKKFIIFRIFPTSTIGPLASKYGISDMPCFPIGGMKKQHEFILESFGTTEGIIYSLTRLPLTTCSLLSSSLSYS